ncbi:Fcf2-domain-containing protein [Nadsonia fulvescens var. elongata DSM 6958]|uniref:Fcf2-domain-containing protein n=1 Tax=Nadsonia fulvescens var. elongata DSM 6958 TaxID=857566 RepID=A0A1E3PGU3_9ASCO|nr:Fcf2-domain-containing protein [Nadsonia fulvescens var. elongata DSM 6958]
MTVRTRSQTKKEVPLDTIETKPASMQPHKETTTEGNDKQKTTSGSPDLSESETSHTTVGEQSDGNNTLSDSSRTTDQNDSEDDKTSTGQSLEKEEEKAEKNGQEKEEEKKEVKKEENKGENKKEEKEKKEEIEILDDESIEALLSAAKQNLSGSTSKVTDIPATKARKGEFSDTFKEIRESFQHLPKLEDGIAVVLPMKLAKNLNGNNTHKKVVSVNSSSLVSAADAKSSNSFRRITDPVKVNQQAKKDSEATLGSKWFDMPKADMTEALKRDLQLIKMRNALDPKRHYRRDTSKLPEYFQQGTIVEGNTEYYSARMNRKERKGTIAGEILQDMESKKFFKRKYESIQSSKMSGKKGFYKKLKEQRHKF